MGLPFSKIIQNGQEYDVKIHRKPDVETETASSNYSYADFLALLRQTLNRSKVTVDTVVVAYSSQGIAGVFRPVEITSTAVNLCGIHRFSGSRIFIESISATSSGAGWRRFSFDGSLSPASFTFTDVSDSTTTCGYRKIAIYY